MASDLVGSLPVVDLRACAVSENLLALYTCFEAVAERVLSIIEDALRLPREHLSSMIVSGNGVLRLIHYRPLPTSVPSGAVRAAAHEDINLITLLVEGSSGGLELQRREGSWMPVASLAGQIVVNVGDMLERVTNGRLHSTTHRAVNPVDAFLTERLTAIRSQETSSP
jgi:isopenicillin N synthase-like dioxygenase